MSDKIRMQDIVIDPTIQARKVSPHTVNTYIQAMRMGATFPPIVVDRKSKRLVCGNHRYYAYKRVIEPWTSVPCEYRDFLDDDDMLAVACLDNMAHGRPLETWDKRVSTHRLRKAGYSVEELSRMFQVPVSKIDYWAGIAVVVVGKVGKKTVRRREPVKRGLEHLAGREVTEEQYEEHRSRDRGVPANDTALSLTRWIENGWIDESNALTMKALRRLYAALTQLLSGKEGV